MAGGEIARLTRRLAEGEEEAFRQFHARYFDRLYRFLLVVTGGREDEAREALQTTLLRVVRYARQHSSEEVFWSWLTVVARSAARDAGRKQRRYLALLGRFAHLGFTREPQATSDNNERLGAALDESLVELTPFDRRLVVAKYIEGVTVKELSLETGLTEKAVESRLLRLRRELREALLKRLK